MNRIQTLAESKRLLNFARNARKASQTHNEELERFLGRNNKTNLVNRLMRLEGFLQNKQHHVQKLYQAFPFTRGLNLNQLIRNARVLGRHHARISGRYNLVKRM